ncbi:hypothetical protein D3C74_426440 [compost metagenome]
MVSCVALASSPATISAYLICPESIMFAARLMPLTKPRHALATSKFIAEDGRPRPLCTLDATDGSRLRRVTDVLISRPISLASTPA